MESFGGKDGRFWVGQRIFNVSGGNQAGVVVQEE
jgi:hypothetical protein